MTGWNSCKRRLRVRVGRCAHEKKRSIRATTDVRDQVGKRGSGRAGQSNDASALQVHKQKTSELAIARNLVDRFI